MQDIPLHQLPDQIISEIQPTPVYRDSFRYAGEALFFMGGQGEHKALFAVARQPSIVEKFKGEVRQLSLDGSPLYLKTCPLTAGNAQALRSTFSNLKPVPLGVRASAGFGDRLGLATPGHVMAVRGTGIAPIFAQQSIREMNRTHRTPGQVLDDATWGAFQAGWLAKVGADADHIKTIEEAALCADEGFSFFTVDPGANLDRNAKNASRGYIEQKIQALPWSELETSQLGFEKPYLNQVVNLSSVHFVIDWERLWRFMATYAAALVQVKMMYRNVVENLGEGNFDFEISVDETETPTSASDHYLFAMELRRMRVRWTSLAPRFSGRFEKGVDYIGDLHILAGELNQHAEISRELGPYKISLHSGSDKFSIYPIAAQALGNLFHLKTAGTSYLEALRTVAQTNPELFRKILIISAGRYATDRSSYHVSAETSNLSAFTGLKDGNLAELLDNFDVRQILHVTFGSVISAQEEMGGPNFGSLLKRELFETETQYYSQLKAHFTRHLAPFVSGGSSAR